MKKKPVIKVPQKEANIQYSCTITIDGPVAKIEGTYLVDPIQDVTSFYTPGFQFTQKYKMGYWDGRTKLFHKRFRTFPAGLSQDVLKALREAGVRVLLDDQRNCPGSPDLSQKTLEGVSFDYPYDFQIECALKMVDGKRGVVAVATNGGKTTIAAMVVKMLKLKTLFMVPNLSLLYQTQKVFQNRLGMDVGIVGDGHWRTDSLVTVASINTLWNRIGEDKCRSFLKSQDVVFADECHHVASNTWFKVLNFCSAYYRFGLSGTPLKRTDGADLKLVGQTGPVLYEIRNKELIERGISVKPHIHFIEINKPNLPKKVPWDEAYKKGIVENAYRNKALCKKVKEFVDKDLSVLVLVREIAHGQAMDKMLLGTSCQFICGEESTEVREKALDEFRNGKIKVIIASSILDEGVDIPNIDVLVLAGGGKSSIATLQRVGRGLRKGGNVDRLYVVDTIDFQQHHLLKHSFQRYEDYKQEDCFEIESIEKFDTCKSCEEAS